MLKKEGVLSANALSRLLTFTSAYFPRGRGLIVKELSVERLEREDD